MGFTEFMEKSGRALGKGVKAFKDSMASSANASRLEVAPTISENQELQVGEHVKHSMPDLEQIFGKATAEELRTLAQILKVKNKSGPAIAQALIDRMNGKIPTDSPACDDPYRQIVMAAAEKLKLSVNPETNVEAVESQIAEKVVTNILKKLSPDQKKELEEELKRQAGYDKEISSDFAKIALAAGGGAIVKPILNLVIMSIFPLGWFLGLFVLPSLIVDGGVIAYGLRKYMLRKREPEFHRIIPAIAYIYALREKYDFRNSEPRPVVHGS
jgi:uncharacterized protein YaaW (UPF0174 family)